MSFWSKISENKIALAAAATAVLGGAVFWAYREYQNQEGSKVETSSDKTASQIAQPSKQFDLRAEIAKLKNEVNVGDLSFEDVKKIFKLITEYVKFKTLTLSGKYKAERRKQFPKESRFSRMPEYMRYAADCLMPIQNAVGQLQNEQGYIMASFGLTQAVVAKFAAQLAPFMQELQLQELDLNGGVNLQNTKKYLQLKTEYLVVHGQKMVEALIQLSSSIPLQEQERIPVFMSVFISDQVFEHQPQLDRDEFELAAQHYRNALTAEIINYENALMPLMGKLQTVLTGDHQIGMGYGGQQYQNEQAMLQQLEAIRQQDPQAYEQIIAMMQAQRGG